MISWSWGPVSPSYFLSYCSSQRLSNIYTDANRKEKKAKFESST